MTTTKPRKAGKPKTLATASAIAALGVFFAAWGGLATNHRTTPPGPAGLQAFATTTTIDNTAAQQPATGTPNRPVPRTRSRSS